jgi:hypothetical protein
MSGLAPLMFAVSLIAVPALFTLFPELTDTALWVRALIVGAWIPIVARTSHQALTQSEHVEELVGPALDRRQQQKILASRRLLLLLLNERTGLPAHYKFRLYTFDPDRQALMPAYAPEDSDAESWQVGYGVTGQAWKRGEYVIARDAEVSDDTYGLTPQQQHRYQHLKIVAALPIRNDRDQMIAILTGSSSTDDGRLRSQDGWDRHQELAQIAGRILMDIARMDVSRAGIR